MLPAAFIMPLFAMLYFNYLGKTDMPADFYLCGLPLV